MGTLKPPPVGSWSPAVSLPSLLLSIRSLMAEPNPDDGLVPEISELYKRNPAEWRREARKRTKLEATVEKLEQMESSLDGETTKSDAKDEDVGPLSAVALWSASDDLSSVADVAVSGALRPTIHTLSSGSIRSRLSFPSFFRSGSFGREAWRVRVWFLIFFPPRSKLHKSGDYE